MSKMSRIENILEKYKEQMWEILYFLIFIIFAATGFFETTMIDFHMTQVQYFYLNVATTVLVVGKAASDPSWKMKDLILAIAVCLGLFASGYRWGYPGVVRLAILIVGAKNISGKKIMRVYFAVCTAILLCTIALALTGRIENLIYYQSGHGYKPRISFGSIYPTDFSAHIFFLSCVYAWLRGRKIRNIELAVFAGLGVFVYVFCDARMNTAALLGLAVFLGYIKFRRSRAAKNGTEYTMTKILRGLCCLSTPIFAGSVIILSYLYNPENQVLQMINLLLSHRLAFGRKAFNLFNVSLVGQYVKMVGAGGTTNELQEYFFLDSSYINILFRMGIVTLVGILIGLVVIQYRENKNSEWEHMGILALVSAQCFVEHHMLEIAYNPFLILLFAAPIVYTVSDKRRKSEK